MRIVSRFTLKVLGQDPLRLNKHQFYGAPPSKTETALAVVPLVVAAVLGRVSATAKAVRRGASRVTAGSLTSTRR